MTIIPIFYGYEYTIYQCSFIVNKNVTKILPNWLELQFLAFLIRESSKWSWSSCIRCRRCWFLLLQWMEFINCFCIYGGTTIIVTNPVHTFLCRNFWKPVAPVLFCNASVSVWCHFFFQFFLCQTKNIINQSYN